MSLVNRMSKEVANDDDDDEEEEEETDDEESEEEEEEDSKQSVVFYNSSINESTERVKWHLMRQMQETTFRQTWNVCVASDTQMITLCNSPPLFGPNVFKMLRQMSSVWLRSWSLW